MLGRDGDTTSDGHHAADSFAAFFAREIEDVCASAAGHPTPVGHVLGCTCRMSSFRPCSQAEVRRTIMKSPVKSCSLDSIPRFLLCEFVDLLLAFVTCMVNASLRQGRLPKSQRHAIVVPVLKKPGLNTSVSICCVGRPQ